MCKAIHGSSQFYNTYIYYKLLFEQLNFVGHSILEINFLKFVIYLSDKMVVE